MRPLLLLAVLATACSPKRAPEVVVYTSVDQPHAEPILDAFEAATGIEVRAVYDVEASKTTGLVTRLDAEKSAPKADVYWSSEVAQTLWLKDQGVLAPYESPAAADISPALRDADHTWCGVGLRARVILVNTERIGKKQRPSSIFELVEGAWEPGQVAIANPLFGTTFTHAATLYATLGPERAHAWFVSVLDGPTRVVDGNSTVRDLVASGEIVAGLTDNDDAYGAIQRGAPVEMIVPVGSEAGALFIPGSASLIAGGPNPDQGKALMDHLVSAEVEATLMDQGFFHASVREPPPGAEISWSDVAAQVPRAREELRELFLR